MAGFLGYVKPRKILSENAYVFNNSGCGFVLSKGEFVVDVEMGLFSSVFANHWIRHSGAPGVVPFEVGFNQSDSGNETGQLCAMSSTLQDEAQNLSPYDRDVMAVEVFCSGEVLVRTGGLDELRTAYILPGFRRDGGLDEASRLGSEEPFHASYDAGLLRLSDDWEQLILARGWSWNLQNGVVYVSNAKSAAFGLPPNFEMLGLPRLELSLLARRNRSVPVVRSTQTPRGEMWEVLADFFHSPCPATLTAVLCSERAQDDLLSMRSCPGYSPGSNRFKLASALVFEMSLHGQFATPANLAAALEKMTATTRGNARQTHILLKKLNSQLQVNAELGTLHFTK